MKTLRKTFNQELHDIRNQITRDQTTRDQIDRDQIDRDQIDQNDNTENQTEEKTQNQNSKVLNQMMRNQNQEMRDRNMLNQEMKMKMRMLNNDMKMIMKKTIELSQHRDQTSTIDYSFISLIDSLLQMNESKKIKEKDRLVRTKNKDKFKNTFITRNSSEFEFVEAKFRQRTDETQSNDIDENNIVDLISETERERDDRADKARERSDRAGRTRERDDQTSRAQSRERDRERERDENKSADVEEVSSRMTSLMQF
jgi:hypothetical protein